MAQKLSIKDLKINGKKVLMRVDFNVPLDKDGKITDDTRIKAALPSIKHVLDYGGALILMSHLGRPKGKASSEFSLAPCAKRLSELLDRPVLMAPDCVGDSVTKMAQNLQTGQILMLENLRFHPEEENPEKDHTFAKQLAHLADLYVNDAFGTAHRRHSSTVLVAEEFIGKSAAGFLMNSEIKFLGELLTHPERPFCAIIGGAKISSKIGVLKALVQKVDVLLIGGGMAYTFLKAQGVSIGNSIHEDEYLDLAKEILEECRKKNVTLQLPVDLVVADKIDEKASVQIVSVDQGIPDGFEGVDIGPKSIDVFGKLLRSAKTIFWNGPVGIFEIPIFAKGTQAIAELIATLPAKKIVGGGDSVAAVQQLDLAEKMTHISTGGGASLEYIEFGTLPGVEALSEKE